MHACVCSKFCWKLLWRSWVLATDLFMFSSNKKKITHYDFPLKCVGCKNNSGIFRLPIINYCSFSQNLRPQVKLTLRKSNPHGLSCRSSPLLPLSSMTYENSRHIIRIFLGFRSVHQRHRKLVLLLTAAIVVLLFCRGNFDGALNFLGFNPSISVKGPIVTCRIPKLNPYDPSIEEYIEEPVKDLDCGYDHPQYFTTDYQGNLIKIRDPSEHGYLSCCYRKFERKRGSEMEFVTATACKRITSNVTKVPTNYEFIFVKCLKSDNDEATWKLVDIFGFVPLKPLAKEVPLADGSPRVNVVVLGIDSVSHMSLMRNFKFSYDYLKNNLSAVGMRGYTKNADNTFPNILPVLSGLSEADLKRTGWKVEQAFDNVPLIWNKFSEEGYRTAFSEDAIQVGLFLHAKRGFVNQPTDYYHHPLLRTMEKLIGHTTHGGIGSMCHGSRLTLGVLLDLVKKMAATMSNDKRYFHFTWATALTHDQLNYGQYGDPLLLETLKWFNNGGYLNHTALILMSDHGIRNGDIRSTLQGKIEERMPFLYFVLPKWFQGKYPSAVRNLKGNENLLTTHFDLHETLMDLLHLSNIENYSLWKRQLRLSYSGEPPRGISLFMQIPPTRTCGEAGISNHWCVCGELKPLLLEGNEVVLEGGKEAVAILNKLLAKLPQCLKLEFDVILSAHVYRIQNVNFVDESEVIRDVDDERLSSQQVTYSISFRVQPSGGIFEATVTHHTDGTWEVAQDISRVNRYGLQSRCISDYSLKKYCYCG